MTTVVGDFAVNFVPLSNVNPYTNSNLSYQTANQTLITGSPSAVNKPTGFVAPLMYYNGAMSSTATIRSKIEIGANPGSFDLIYLHICKSASQVYYVKLNGTGLEIGDVIGGFTPASTTLGSAPIAGDQVVFEYVPGTRVATVYVNGTSVLNATISSTAQTGLTFGFGFDAGNGNAATIKSFAGDGIASTGGSVLLLSSRLTGDLREFSGHLG